MTATPAVTMTCLPSSASASSCSSSSTSHLASPPVCVQYFCSLDICSSCVRLIASLIISDFPMRFFCLHATSFIPVTTAVSWWDSPSAGQGSGLPDPGGHRFSPQGLVWSGRQQQEFVLLWHGWFCHGACSFYEWGNFYKIPIKSSDRAVFCSKNYCSEF